MYDHPSIAEYFHLPSVEIFTANPSTTVAEIAGAIVVSPAVCDLDWKERRLRAEFGRAQEIEERFNRDFDEVDFTIR
jgi:hypothetical protein